jgi:hypothetical protein
MKLCYTITIVIVLCYSFIFYAKTPWTILVYLSADNNLLSYADRNIEEMKKVGSSENLTILVHLDAHRHNKPKTTQRFIIQKNDAVQIGTDMLMDSGNAQTLVDACRWALQDFPSEKFCLIIWNHGSGILEPTIQKILDMSALLYYHQQKDFNVYNPSLLNYSPLLCQPRGICFDDSTGHFITNHQLRESLSLVCNEYRQGKNIDVLCCDACLMGSFEVAYSLAPIADYFVASEEVELALSYPYQPLLQQASLNPTTEDFAKIVVSCFDDFYKNIMYDYTHMAFNLSYTPKICAHLNQIALLLINALAQQKNQTVANFLRKSSARNNCVYFSEPSYKDLTNLLLNFKNNSSTIQLNTTIATTEFQSQIIPLLQETVDLLSQSIISYCVSPNLKNAHGLSIYFPEKIIHASYAHTDFGKDSTWCQLITQYLAHIKTSE